MAGSEEDRTTEWRPVSKLYRRPPGLAWLLGLLVVPLVLGAIGHGMLDKSKKETSAPSVNASPSMTAAAPSVSVTAPNAQGLSFTRNGNDVTVSGTVPDEATRASLLSAVKASFGPDVNVVDKLTLSSGAPAPDISAVSAVLKAGASIPGFGLNVGAD